MLVLLTVAFISLFFFLGTQRSNTVSSLSEHFPHLEDKQCVDDAVQKTPGVKYLSAKSTSEHVRTPTGHAIEIADHVVEYSIIEGKSFEKGILKIHESTLQGKDRIESDASYSNISIDVQADKPSSQEFDHAYAVIKEMNSQVKDTCGLKEFSPYFFD